MHGPAAKWCKSGAENHACIQQVGTVNNLVAQAGPAFVKEWLHERLGQLVKDVAAMCIPVSFGLAVLPATEPLAGFFAQVARLNHFLHKLPFSAAVIRVE